MKSNTVYMIGIAILAIVAAAVGFMVFKPKPKQPESMNALFVYNPTKGVGTDNLLTFDTREPGFSIKLPARWYFDKNRIGNKRLMVQSPTTTIKGYQFRAMITVSVLPTKNTLEAEIANAKKEISTVAINHAFLTTQSVKINGYPAYQLEYEMYRPQDAEAIKTIIGQTGPVTHTVDIITVKDGYLVDVAAMAFAWQWKDYGTTIQQALNSFTFLNGNTP